MSSSASAAGDRRREVLGRIRAALRTGSYLVPVRQVPASQRAHLAEIARGIADPSADPERLRTRIRQLQAAGRLDRIRTLSALAVLAASPLVRDHAEALRLVGQQELAALDEGGPDLDANLASVARHRGVTWFLLGRDEHALDWFTRAMERERSAENVGNVLAVLLRLGEVQEAEGLVAGMERVAGEGVVAELRARIAEDEDLTRLRR
jgi:hypothetical protein